MRSGHFKQSYAELVALTDSQWVRLWTAVLLAGLIVLPFVAGGYALLLATRILVLMVGVIGLNMLIGGTGLVSLGHSGFMAIGAYALAILTGDYGVPTLPAILAAGLVAAAASLLVGVPSLRLKGLYLAITTLAFGIIVTHLILAAEGLTRGSAGMMVRPPSVGGLSLSDPVSFYYFALAVGVLATLAALNIRRTRIGRAFLSIRDHDIAASMMGIDLVRYKLLAFMVSSFFTGVSGAMLACQVRYINVDTFDFLISIEAIAMIIVGGLGSTAGAILGTIFMTLLPEAVRILFEALAGGLGDLLQTRAYEIRAFVYGVVIVLFLRFEPDGLIGKWDDVKRYWSNWPFRF